MNVEQLILGIYSGSINLFNLPLPLYTATSNKLLQGIIQGYGGGLADFAIGSPDYELAKKLHLNIYNFSGAKTFQEVRSIQSKIMDEKGYVRSFNEFKKDAEKLHEVYNVNWLETEYNTAINQSYSASRWNEIQENKDIFKYLRYQTAGDERVRDEHAELDNIVKPVDDPFWDTFMPPNGWNCFTPDTLISTPNGFIKISELKINDIVFGGSGNERRIDFIHINSFDGNLINIIVAENSVLCTDNHRILTIKGWVESKFINPFDVIIDDAKSSSQNLIIRYVNNCYVLACYIIMSIIIKWKSICSKTFNSNIQFRNKNINPIRFFVIIVNSFISNTFKIFNNNRFTFSWFGCFINMSRNIFSKISFSCNSSLSNSKRIKKRTCNFKFIRNRFKTFTCFFSFTKIRMWNPLKTFFKLLACFLFPFIIIYPLALYCITAISNWYIKIIKKICNSSIVAYIPSFLKFSVCVELNNIKFKENFGSGAPLDSFDSINVFLYKSMFHKKLNLVTSTKIQKYFGYIYNLSVEKDETYITKIGIVHNCRCIVIEEENITEKEIKQSEKAEQDLKDLKKENKKEYDKQYPPLFRENVGKTGKVFKETHPYYDVPSKYSELKARNFDLPIPNNLK